MKLHVSRLCVIVSAATAAVGCADREPEEDSQTMQDARAHAIHEAVMTIDSHDDIPFDFATEAVDPLDAARQLNLEKMRAGGLNAADFRRRGKMGDNGFGALRRTTPGRKPMR